MLYTCSRERNGHQPASDKCTSATTLNASTRRRRDSPGNSSRTVCPGAGTPARGISEAVRAQSSSYPGSSTAVGGRGADSFLSSSWHSGRQVLAGGDRGSFLDPNRSRGDRVEALSPENDRLGLSQVRVDTRSDRQRSQSCAFLRIELGISRESSRPSGFTEDAQYHQDAPQSRVPISPRGLPGAGLQEKVSKRAPANPGSVPVSERRGCSCGSASASVGGWQFHSCIPSPSEERHTHPP